MSTEYFKGDDNLVVLVPDDETLDRQMTLGGRLIAEVVAATAMALPAPVSREALYDACLRRHAPPGLDDFTRFCCEEVLRRAVDEYLPPCGSARD